MQIMSHKYNCLMEALLQKVEFALQFISSQRIERAERLIHQQNFRIARQRPRHAYTLPLPARQLMRIAKCQFRWQPDNLQHFLDARADAFLRPAFDFRYQAYVLRHREVRKQPNFLDDVPNPASEPNYFGVVL